jgi:RES domain-containing protein
VVYLASSPAAALLEALVHELSLADLPGTYQWLEIDADVRVAPPPRLPPEWHDDLIATRAAGDAWLTAGETALLEVPSIIVPKTANYLLNPRHPDAGSVRIAAVIRYPLDTRLAR